MRVIWSACHTDGFHEEHLHRVIERAAREGVSGVEISGRAIDAFVAHRAFPALNRQVDSVRLEARQASLRRVAEHAARAGLTLGIWHHEVEGPDSLLDLLPELRAADGLLDLESPLLYRFVTEKCREFFDLFPAVAELVLTLTETKFVVMRRPFSPLPPAERIRRLLAAVAAATEPLGKRLVVRPFSALRADELHVREALLALNTRHLSVMYKTEPFDWNPFLPDEELIGSIPTLEARAETDGGAEYYGQSDFPACYTRLIGRRFEAARRRGATVAVIRVDRGHGHSALGHPLNEVNVVAPTRWLLDTSQPLVRHWEDWFAERHGACPPGMEPLLERTFEVIEQTLYIHGQSITHRAFPTLAMAKHIQVFHLFEEHVPLDHMAEHWSMLADRSTVSHTEILQEKEAAVALARQIVAAFDAASRPLAETARRAIREHLLRLEWLALACRALCRLIAAHTEEMWRYPQRAARPFEKEAEDLLDLAARLEEELGDGFFRGMPAAMRDFVEGLRAERAAEMPLRQRIEQQAGLVDYVLCGFASEGHRLRKRLHSGRTPWRGSRPVRLTGIGEEEGFTFHLRTVPNQPMRLVVTFAAGGSGAGVVRIGEREMSFGPMSGEGVPPLAYAVPARPDKELPVRFWSTTAEPCAIATLELFRCKGGELPS